MLRLVIDSGSGVVTQTIVPHDDNGFFWLCSARCLNLYLIGGVYRSDPCFPEDLDELFPCVRLFIFGLGPSFDIISVVVLILRMYGILVSQVVTSVMVST